MQNGRDDDVYLDTSAAVPLFVPEPATDRIHSWFETCTATLVSSDWILGEFASALGTKVRRGELQQRQAKAAWKEFERFSRTGLRLVPISRETFSRAARLIQQIRGALRAGDSLHLASATEIGAASVATADAELEKSARATGLGVTRFQVSWRRPQVAGGVVPAANSPGCSWFTPRTSKVTSSRTAAFISERKSRKNSPGGCSTFAVTLKCDLVRISSTSEQHSHFSEPTNSFAKCPPTGHNLPIVRAY
jgi:hypothetical protein